MADALKITKRSSVLEIEEMCKQVEKSQPKDPIIIWLPRDHGYHLFKMSRICALLAQSSRRGRLIVTDWVNNWTEDDVWQRFGTRPDGVSAIVYGHLIRNAADQVLPLSKPYFFQRWTGIRRGLIELDAVRHRSMTFCAFDPEAPVPQLFANVNDPETFRRIFVQFRARYFEIGASDEYSLRISQEWDHHLGTCIFELLQNSLQHGRFDASSQLIHGVRFFGLRRHIDHIDRRNLKNAAHATPEFLKYLDSLEPSRSASVFYEVTIADHGLGIVDRILATRKDILPAMDEKDRTALINRIISESLSSKTNSSGAGYGLQRAMKAAIALRGFVSLRTDRLWLWGGSALEHTPGVWLAPMSGSEGLAKVPGTEFSIIIPLS